MVMVYNPSGSTNYKRVAMALIDANRVGALDRLRAVTQNTVMPWQVVVLLREAGLDYGYDSPIASQFIPTSGTRLNQFDCWAVVDVLNGGAPLAYVGPSSVLNGGPYTDFDVSQLASYVSGISIPPINPALDTDSGAKSLLEQGAAATAPGSVTVGLATKAQAATLLAAPRATAPAGSDAAAPATPTRKVTPAAIAIALLGAVGLGLAAYAFRGGSK